MFIRDSNGIEIPVTYIDSFYVLTVTGGSWFGFPRQWAVYANVVDEQGQAYSVSHAALFID